MNWIHKHRKTLPIYSVGLVWFLYALVKGYRTPGDYFSCAVLSLAVAALLTLLLRKKGEETQEKAPKAEEPAKEKTLLQQGREYVQKIEQLNKRIPDFEVSARLKQMTLLTEEILAVVEKQPEKEHKIRRIISYYLPTVIKLLEQYALLQDVQSSGENVQQAKDKITDVLEDVNIALKKQLDQMFEADLMDITAEIRVMEKKLEEFGLTQDATNKE